MPNEHVEWIMHGLSESDPRCLRSPAELSAYIDKVGFLPLFKNQVSGFSVEELTAPDYWWSGDEKRDPWEWRAIIAREGKIAYGKFFERKAGFISPKWLPRFINYRRDGYDFDALWDDGKVKYAKKRIMDLFADSAELFSYEMKQKAGFGKDGEKNFDGLTTELQMQTYLVNADFRCRLNKAGIPYGWAIAVFTTPEQRWGAELVASAYREAPERSWTAIIDHAAALYPQADKKQLEKLLK